jgi:hypothetical protein
MGHTIYTVYTQSIYQSMKQASFFLCSSQMVHSPNGTFAKWFIRQKVQSPNGTFAKWHTPQTIIKQKMLRIQPQQWRFSRKSNLLYFVVS